MKQSVSLVAPDRLRFDFSHFTAITPRELEHQIRTMKDKALQAKAGGKSVERLRARPWKTFMPSWNA